MNYKDGYLGIARLSIKHFKALRAVELDLKSLNYLLGENSLGKSSVTQALRFFAQNLRDSSPQDFKLNLPGLKLGQYKKVITEGSKEGFSIDVELALSTGQPNSEGAFAVEETCKISSAFYPREQTFRRNISDMVSGGIRPNDFMALEKDPEMKTKVPLQDFSFTLGTTQLRFSPTFAGVKRWVYGRVGDIELPTGTWVEFKEKNLLGAVNACLTKNAGKLRFKTLSLDRKKLRDILRNVELQSDDEVGPFKVLRVSLEDAFVILVQRLVNSSGKLGIESVLSDEISAEEIVPRFEEFLERPIVTARQIISNRGNHYSDNSPDLHEVVSEFAMHWNEGDEHIWREDTDIDADDLLDEIFYVLKIDFKNADPDEMLRFFAERCIFGLSHNIYDLWLDPLPSSFFGNSTSTLELSMTQANSILTEKLHYVGPLRGDGYTVQNVDRELDSFLPVGLVGEQIVQRILDEAEQSTGGINLSDLVRTIREKSENFTPKYKYPCPDGKTTPKLVSALESWIQYFELGNKVLIQDLGVLGLQVFIDQKNLYHLGSGVSQILPVIVACLVAEPGSLTMIEQPELHLHPAAQQKLADFFLSISQSGRNLLIETHSEYMINRTRRDVVLKKANAKDIQLFFAERGEGETTIRAANLSGSGGFEYWPKGFFSQTEDDLLEILRSLDE